MGNEEPSAIPAAVLQFEWNEVHGAPVLAILGETQPWVDDDRLEWRAVALVLGAKVVTLEVNDDTDEVIAILEDIEELRGGDWRPIEGLQFLVGENLAWCWSGANWLGYFDAFTLSFGAAVPEALEPRIMFLAQASCLSCSLIGPLTSRA